MLLLMLTTAIALGVSGLQLIRIGGMVDLRTWTLPFVDAHVSARTPPFADPADGPSLADTLIVAGRTGMLGHPNAVADPATTPNEALLNVDVLAFLTAMTVAYGAPLYHASLGFYGSPAESTAIAVRALPSWMRTPAGAAAP